MRLSELTGKEVINLLDGSRLGTISCPEAILDLRGGVVESLIMTSRRWFVREEKVIPWKDLHKISTDLILVQLNKERENE